MLASTRARLHQIRAAGGGATRSADACRAERIKPRVSAWRSCGKRKPNSMQPRTFCCNLHARFPKKATVYSTS
jgi:hypothetical protein